MASISTPTQLATFSQPHASSSKAPHIVLSPVIGNPNSAVAAVRGDGVWTYDLSTLRPTTSFTVPPSTSFTSNAVSYWTTSVPVPKSRNVDGEQEEEQMDVDAGADLESTEAPLSPRRERVTLVGVGKEIWVWKGEEGDKEVISLDSPVKALHHLSSSQHPIIAISSSAQVYLLDGSLKPASVKLQGTTRTLSASRVLASSVKTFRLMMVDSEGDVAVWQISLDDGVQAEKVVGGSMGAGRISFADISADGVVTVLHDKNNLFTRDIPSLSSAKSSPLSLVHPPTTPALLSLPTSGKPLVLIPTSHPSPSLLLAIPLSTLPAVLASTSISSFTSTGAISHLSVLSSREGIITVGVVLSHLNGDGDSGRSVIYTCEVVVPPKGIGMAALLGVQQKTLTYLSPSSSGSSSTARTDGDKRQDELISQLSGSIKKKDVSGAEKSWKDWASVNAEQVTEQLAKRIVTTVFGAALNDDGKVTGAYAGSIIRDLIQRGIVNDAMWKQGVVEEGLLPCGDWETILLALRQLRTIPSSSLVALITASSHPTASNQESPSMIEVLRAILALPPPAPTFRLDLRRGLRVEDATAVLSQLVHWAEEHVSLRSEGLKGWDSGVSPSAMPQGDRPSLDSTITYSSLLLDSHLPSFLSYEPSHELLERLQATLEPLMAVQTEYRQLRGPVEAVLTLARREARKAEEREVQQRSKGRQDKKKGGAHGKDEKSKLPEEVVGKWKVEDLVF
ncbi:hypothetical protein IAU60_002339 [Kwoniella sp. DSM 27419]